MHRILHLDDAADDRLLIGLHLRRVAPELDIRSAETIQEAFAFIGAEQFDCIVCDYFLSASSGITFLEELRGRGNQTPVIFLVGQGSVESAVAAFRAGASDYLTKDEIYDNFGILAERIAAALARSDGQNAPRPVAPGAERNPLSDSILACINELVVIANGDGAIIYCAPSVRTVLGFEPDEIMGDRWWQATSLDAATAASRRARVVAQACGDNPVPQEHYEVTMRHRDGSPRTVLWRDARGPGGILIGVGIDISENRRVADALQASEERYLYLLQNATFPIVITGVDGTIFFINEKSEQLFGYTADEARQINALDVYVDHKLRQVMLDTLRAEGNVWDFEIPLYRKSGQIFWALLSAKIITYQNQQALFVSLIDITERHEMELALRQSEQRYRLLAENVRDVIWTMDLKGRFTYISPSVESLRGYTPDEVKRQSLEEVIDQRSIPVVLKGLEEAQTMAALGKQVAEHEYEVLQPRRDGSVVSTGVTTRLLYHDDGTVEILGVTRDISDRKQAEENLHLINRKLEEQSARLAEMNRELDSFAHTISHDLRAPLRRIAGYIQLMLSDESTALPQPTRDMLERIDQASRGLYKLVENILTFSRTARGEINCSAVNLSEMAHAVMRELAADRTLPHHASLQWSVQENLRCEADPALMRVVLENLLGNAIKFTGLTAEPRVELYAAENETGETVFTVRDNGAGFDPGHSADLFAPFVRLHTETEFQGTGIGCATAKRIIERHGGRIWAEGTPGAGAAFHFTLPAGG